MPARSEPLREERPGAFSQRDFEKYAKCCTNMRLELAVAEFAPFWGQRSPTRCNSSHDARHCHP